MNGSGNEREHSIVADVMELSGRQLAQADWITRVLGVRLTEAGAPPGAAEDDEEDEDEADGAGPAEDPAARLSREIDAVVQRCDATAELIETAPEAEVPLEAALAHAARARASLQAGDHQAAGAALVAARSNLAAMTARVQESTAALEQGAAPPAQPARREGDVVRMGKAILKFTAARSSVAQQVATLQAAILDAHKDHPRRAEIEANLDELDAVLDQFDDALTDKLHALRATQDPAEKAAISAEARQVIAARQAAIAGDELIADLDDNGYVPLTVRATLEAMFGEILGML